MTGPTRESVGEVSSGFWTAPLSEIEGATDLSGLEQLQKIAAGELPQPPIGPMMGMKLIGAEYGKASFRGVPNPDHRNLMGVVHGGYAILLLDSALGCAVHSTLPPRQTCASVSIEVKLVRGLEADVGALRADASVVHQGRTQSTAEGRLILESTGALVAHGTATCITLREST